MEMLDRDDKFHCDTCCCLQVRSPCEPHVAPVCAEPAES